MEGSENKQNRRDFLVQAGAAAAGAGLAAGLSRIGVKKPGAEAFMDKLLKERSYEAELTGKSLRSRPDGTLQYLLALTLDGASGYYEVTKDVFDSFADNENVPVTLRVKQDRTLHIVKR